MSIPRGDSSVTPPSDTGFGAAPSWFIRNPSVTRSAKLVYLVLSTYTGGSKVVFPSQETIAKQISVSVPTVKRAITELRKLGYVRVITERTAHGRRNNYLLMIHPFSHPRDHG